MTLTIERRGAIAVIRPGAAAATCVTLASEPSK